MTDSVTTTIRLDTLLRDRIKDRAAAQGETMAAMFTRAAEAYAAGEEIDPERARRNEMLLDLLVRALADPAKAMHAKPEEIEFENFAAYARGVLAERLNESHGEERP